MVNTFQVWQISEKYFRLEKFLIAYLNQNPIIYGLKMKSVYICVNHGVDFHCVSTSTECLMSLQKTKFIQLL